MFNYVEALAEFLTNDKTEAPLTISIEGEWGSGKTSFMRMLERKISEKTNQKANTIWFNAWRHEKAESMWAAFAILFLRELRNNTSWGQRIRKELKLFCSRSENRWNLFLILIPRLILIILLVLSPLLLLEKIRIYFIYTFTSFLGINITFGLLKSTFVNSSRIFDFLNLDFQKFQEYPKYKEKIEFAEKFNEDFNKITESYLDKNKLFVFVDDLDRCDPLKAADLINGINLIIDNKRKIIFILGLDRIKLAASLAVKNEKILNYLKNDYSIINENISNYSSNLSIDQGLLYGFNFIEKFIQVSFQLPRVSDIDVERLFNHIYSNEKISINKIKDIFSRVGDKEIEFYSNPQRNQKILEMVAPALDYNPRRIKKFINVLNLNLYIAFKTGLFDEFKTVELTKEEPITPEQIGKFTAITIKWPLLLKDLEKDIDLLKKMEFLAFSSYELPTYKFYHETSVAEYWMKDKQLFELILYNCYSGLNPNFNYQLSLISSDKFFQLPASRTYVRIGGVLRYVPFDISSLNRSP
jgi:hypothetical protein